MCPVQNPTPVQFYGLRSSERVSFISLVRWKELLIHDDDDDDDDVITKKTAKQEGLSHRH